MTDAVSWNLKWVKEGRRTYGEEWLKLTKIEMKDRAVMRLKNRSTRKNEQKRWEGAW